MTVELVQLRSGGPAAPPGPRRVLLLWTFGVQKLQLDEVFQPTLGEAASAGVLAALAASL